MLLNPIEYDNYILPNDYDNVLPRYLFKYFGEIVDNEQILEKIIGEIPGNGLFDKLLEIGCGTSRLTKYLVPFCSSYCGVDISFLWSRI